LLLLLAYYIPVNNVTAITLTATACFALASLSFFLHLFENRTFGISGTGILRPFFHPANSVKALIENITAL